MNNNYTRPSRFAWTDENQLIENLKTFIGSLNPNYHITPTYIDKETFGVIETVNGDDYKIFDITVRKL